jgi:hypothetical protein
MVVSMGGGTLSDGAGLKGEVATAEVGRRPEWEFTGNHDLAFPLISTLDGGIHSISVLHRGVFGALEWGGSGIPGHLPLLAPEVREGGEPVPLGELSWERLDRWIPRFHAQVDRGLSLVGTLCAPGGADPGATGAVYLLELENHGSTERELEFGVAGGWQRSTRTIISGREITAPNRVMRGRAVPGLVLELGGEPGLAALALLASGDDAFYLTGGEGEVPSELAIGAGYTSTPGEKITLRIARRVRVAPGKRATFAIYLAAAVERDGALERVAALRQRGAREMIRAGRLTLAQMTRRTADPALGALLNRNLLFNAFFSVGRAVDDERLYPVVSRSPVASLGAVFRERDALLWSLPALQLADPRLAREVLLRAFEQYSHRAGAHIHYLDGNVLSGSFALDQFCAYGVALDRYLRETGDETILEEAIIGDVLRELDEFLTDHLHPTILLAATEILPSGEPPAHPYVTYDNVLLWALCRSLERFRTGAGEGEETAPIYGEAAAEEVAAAIWRYCAAEVEGLRILACSTDLAGEAAVYDDPEGSLLTLPALGFCAADDPLWRNTVEFLHSGDYPFWLGKAEFPGLSSRSHPDLGSLPALCAALVGPRQSEALTTLRRLRLDGDVASRWYDTDTGASAEGMHHAAAAGLLAWTLWHAVEG